MLTNANISYLNGGSIISNEQLVEQYQLTKDNQYMEDLINDNSPLIHMVCRRFNWQSKHYDYNDLYQEGVIAFMRAVDTYNSSIEKPTKFSSWAFNMVTWRLVRYVDTMKKPREISSDTVISDDDSDEITLEDTICDKKSELEYELIEIKELKQEVRQAIKKNLSLMQKQVIELYFGFYGFQATHEEVCETLKLDMQQGRYLHYSAIDKLRYSQWGRKKIKEYYGNKIIKEHKSPEAEAIRRIDYDNQIKEMLENVKLWRKQYLAKEMSAETGH